MAKSAMLPLVLVPFVALAALATDEPGTGLVVHYPLDGNGRDAGPGRFHGDVCGAEEVEGHSGPGSEGLAFDGVNDFVDLADALGTVGQLSRGTISVWFRIDVALDQTGNRPNPAADPPFPGVPQDLQLAFPVLFLGAADPVVGNSSLMIYPVHPNRHPTAHYTVMRNALPADPTAVPPRPAGRPFYCFDSCAASDLRTCDGPGEDVLAADRWYHFVVTVDETGNRGFLDGVELVDRRFSPERSSLPDLAAYPPGPGIPSEANDTEFFDDVVVQHELQLGRGFWGWGIVPQFLDGAIDDLRIYDRVLTVDEIAALHQGTEPISWWDWADDLLWGGLFDFGACGWSLELWWQDSGWIEAREQSARWADGWGDWWAAEHDNGESEAWWAERWW